jgi:hypothetical protein
VEQAVDWEEGAKVEATVEDLRVVDYEEGAKVEDLQVVDWEEGAKVEATVEDLRVVDYEEEGAKGADWDSRQSAPSSPSPHCDARVHSREPGEKTPMPRWPGTTPNNSNTS